MTFRLRSPVPTEHHEHELGQVVRPLRAFCLRRFDDDFAAQVDRGAPNMDRAGVEVDVAPTQGAKLGASEAGANRRRYDRP